MPENPPMLNSPAEGQSEVAEEFAQKVVSRRDGERALGGTVNAIVAEAVKPDVEHMERDK